MGTILDVTVSPLVDNAFVTGRIGRAGTVFLDMRPKPAFVKAHVPGAIHTDYNQDGWRIERDGVNGLLPDVPDLEKLIGGLGIGNGDHVVLLAPGNNAWDIGIATRLYWTLKVLGHRRLSILNGGMRAYLLDPDTPRESGEATPVATDFRAIAGADLVAREADIQDLMIRGGLLLDSRPTDQYLGLNKTGDVERHGTLPGAASLPGQWLTIDGGGTFRDIGTLHRLYDVVGIPEENETIAFCNTGHWSTLGWFVHSELLGHRPTKMYDASLAEWSRLDPNQHPMEVKVQV